MFRNLEAKCANPACPTPFDYLAGGKFFRFRRDPATGNAAGDSAPPLQGHHGVEHFWLCERCSQRFALVYEPRCGVVLRLRWDEPLAATTHKQLTAA